MISCALAALVVLILAVDDLFAYCVFGTPRDPKGYNFGKTGLGWFIPIGCLPIINLLVILIVGREWVDNIRVARNAKLREH